MTRRKTDQQQNISRGMELEDYLFSVSETEMATLERPLEKKRIEFFWWIVLIFTFIVAGRVFYLNVVKGEYYQDISKNNRIRSIMIKAPRGKILDRSGISLVNNVPSLDAVFMPADLPRDRESLEAMVQSLTPILNLNSADVLSKIDTADRRSFNPVLLKNDISQEESLALVERQREFPGILIEKTAIREYVDGAIFSHILGYQGKIEKKELEQNPEYSLTDYIGKQGVEKIYEKSLRGVDGAVQVEVDAIGNVKKDRGTIQPKAGSDLVLGIDAQLQRKLSESLRAVTADMEAKTAAAVAIDPRNGEVLALVSLPSFDNNLFSKKISQENYLSLINDPATPLFNRAISGSYPPGSTLKPVVAVAGLMEGTIDEGTTVGCTGAIHVGSFRFGDWKTHGTVDVRKAIAESCDVFFYSVGGGYAGIPGLGMSRMKQYETAFGLGSKTGIDLAGEVDGFIPDEAWKLEKFGEKWYIGNSYHASIGQGYVTTTPVQLANYIAAIANGGTLYQPHVAKEVRKIDGTVVPVAPKVLHDNQAYAAAIKIVREGMRQTVTGGTAQSLNTLPVAVAGKTGTAQFGSESKTHAWFASFAPYDNPTIAMIVLVEGGGEGHSSAVPVTKDVYQWYFSR
ncbi:penicillin-binding protein 2 [Patescibacteria group bacterium]|nr:MAG: penicillin-binding protein 2 [Patescibacteria group bacterium]